MPSGKCGSEALVTMLVGECETWCPNTRALDALSLGFYENQGVLGSRHLNNNEKQIVLSGFIKGHH